MARKPPAPLAAADQLALDEALQGLIRRYGAAHVRMSAAKLGKAKVGRKKIPDWRRMKDDILQDANDWLDGKDPFALRSDYAIAKAYSQKYPGQSHDSTHSRILRKLGEQREYNFRVTAWEISENERPFADYFRAALALAGFSPGLRESVLYLAERYRRDLEQYRASHGEPPPEMTIAAIHEHVARPPDDSLASLLRDYALWAPPLPEPR
jgi:hypothetical protein